VVGSEHDLGIQDSHQGLEDAAAQGRQEDLADGALAGLRGQPLGQLPHVARSGCRSGSSTTQMSTFHSSPTRLRHRSPSHRLGVKPAAHHREIQVPPHHQSQCGAADRHDRTQGGQALV
jgi:hypothetical protein